MGENSKIEWTDHTFNPWVGCTKISPACINCYAEVWAKRSGLVVWGPHAERRRTTPANWRLPLKWDHQAASQGRRFRVFCASLADIFDNQVPQLWREDLWALIRSTPNLDWIIVTKRIGNAAAMLPADWGNGYPNVWLVATVCNQDEANRDVPKLLKVPAAVRGLSMEPLLGPVNLTAIVNPTPNKLDWVIVGGESGPHARPMHPLWVRYLRDKCTVNGTAFFFKQWGEWRWGGRTSCGWYFYPSQIVGGCQDGEGALFTPNPPDHDWGDGHVAIRVGKKAAGHLLDGREHRDVPSC